MSATPGLRAASLEVYVGNDGYVHVALHDFERDTNPDQTPTDLEPATMTMALDPDQVPLVIKRLQECAAAVRRQRAWLRD